MIGIGIAITPGLALAGGGGAVSYEWLMRDEFVTDRAVGAINGTPAEPSSATTRAVVDTTSKATILGEQFRLSAGNAFGDPMIQWQPGFTRANGIFVLFGTGVQGSIYYGLARAADAQPTELMIYPATPFIKDNSDLAAITIDTLPVHTAYLIVLRSKGAHFFVLDTLARWRRVFVANTSTQNTLYPAVTSLIQAIPNLEHVRVGQLSAPWTADFGAAIEYQATAAANATATMTADGDVECTWTPAAGETLDIEVRRSDADNAWVVRCSQGGSTVKIVERNAGVETERASVANAFAIGAGCRIYIYCQATKITAHAMRSSTRTQVSYTSAFNQSATGVMVTLPVTDFATWRRYETLIPTAITAAIDVPTGLEATAEVAALKPQLAAGGAKTVVYLGGSITNGTAASNPATESWRALTAAYLDATYPGATFTHINSGVGGTISWYGLIRLATDVIDHAPDLVLIDFAANDGNADVQQASAEALIRRLRAALPNAAIIGNLFGGYPNYLTNVTTNSGEDIRRWWRRLFAYYSIPWRDYTTMMESVVAGGGDMSTYQADFVHPNTAGHALAGAGVQQVFTAPAAGALVDWSTQLSGLTRLHADTGDYENTPIVRVGTDNDGETGTWATDGTARQSSTADSTIAWTGTCQSFGFDTNFGVGSGVVGWSLDGGAYTNIDLTTRAVGNTLVTSFARGAHTITLKVISGTVRINRFLAI